MTRQDDREMARAAGEWLRQVEADDQAALEGIRARYQLPPAATMDELLAAMNPADAETVRGIVARQARASADADAFAGFRESVRAWGQAEGLL